MGIYFWTHSRCQVMDDFHFYLFLIMLVFTLLILIPLKCYYCCRSKKIREPGERQEDIRNSVRREPGQSQEDVWSISIPETSELPSYQELEANPGYWSLYNNQTVISKQGNIIISSRTFTVQHM